MEYFRRCFAFKEIKISDNLEMLSTFQKLCLANDTGTLDVIGVKIPRNAENLQEFSSLMKSEEERILNYFYKIF